MQTYPVAPFPDDEDRRLATLAEYALLDSSGEAAFDAFTRLAAQMCGTPISLISLLDRDREWFTSAHGLPDRRQIPRQSAFCAYTVAAHEMVEIPDTRLDERFADNPLVVGEPHVRFYAGVPLTVANGEVLGALCVMDRRPRTLTSEQRGALRTIGEMIVAAFEQRRGNMTPPLVRANQRLVALSAVARSLFDALEPRVLVETLVRCVSELTDGAGAKLFARSANGDLTATFDLASDADAATQHDEILVRAASGRTVQLADDGWRAAIPILSASGSVAYVLDIECMERPLAHGDVFAFELLGQYFAIAVRNVELYAEILSRRAAVVELNEVKSDLIAMLAHDFKAPLTTIVGLADVLAQDERFDAESREFLLMINASAMRLAGLATDTLALSRLEQNELPLRFESVDIVALVRDIVRVLSVTRSIDLRCVADKVVVRADRARLRQVFENVIGNAIKYSPRGDNVEVTISEQRSGVEIAVRDWGIGIRTGDMARVFGRFARGSNARENHIGGAGFGLFLSRTIVERHGGAITIESQEGSGSTFRVLVPKVPAPQRSGYRRILLLDCEDEARSFIAHSLRDDGYAVYSVTNEAELLRALDEGRYDAAIVDMDMLVISKAELVARIARRTALVRLVTMPEPDATSWNPVLCKPFLIRDLQAVVDCAVAERRRGPRRSSESGGVT